MKITFQARVYKVLKVEVEAPSFKEAEKLARVRIEDEVEKEDYRDWQKDGYYIHAHPDDYPTRHSWSNDRNTK